jgi:predicted O-methyltransferase YrrM
MLVETVVKVLGAQLRTAPADREDTAPMDRPQHSHLLIGDDRWLEACPVLKEMLASETTYRPSGEPVRLQSGLDREAATILHRLVVIERPSAAIEIGMAYGVSTLAMLAALERVGGTSRLVSIDPFQWSQWDGCGTAAVRRAELSTRHHLIEEPDYLSLPGLLQRRATFDFAFIDGWHTFDHVLLNFWYLDRMLTVGGIMAFDDYTMASVRKAVRFALSHRKYEEVVVHTATAEGTCEEAGGSIGRQAPKPRQLRCKYLRKLDAWEPNWDFFAEF